MIESQKNRVSKLEQHGTKSDQKKEYCGCRCHWKYIEDFMEITDEKLIRVAEIIESFGGYRLEDGTWRTYADDLEERSANRPPCTCSCSH